MSASRNGGESVPILGYLSDTGAGVPPGEEEKIFAKFYRVAADEDGANSKGTGLGLAIAKALVEFARRQ